MRCKVVLAAAVVCGAAPAQAGNVLKFGPAPAWVVPVAPPPAKPDASGSLDLRVFDLQTMIDVRGLHIFGRQILKVLSPAGLQAAGNALVQWQPQFGDATVHSVRIRRGTETIDMLKDGKGFNLLRREQSLESAQLDGILTALMPIPDVRVGDEVEVAFTVDRANPVMAGHVESDVIFGPQPVPADRFFVRYGWTAGRAVRWREGDGLPRAVRVKVNGIESLTIDRTFYSPPAFAAGAPGRFVAANRFQVGDFADWAQVAGLMTPLFAHAAALSPGSPVASEAARIAATTADPKARALAALQLVQGQVRYLADVQGLGGYVPTSADAVWAARSGDCKGKTVLLLALLRALGVEAVPALVSSRQGDGLDQSLPVPGRFDHVLVRASLDGRSYWLDGARMGDRNLDLIAPPPFEWALPLTDATKTLVSLPLPNPTRPDTEFTLDLDARAGFAAPATATATGVLRGDGAIGASLALASMDAAKRDEFLRGFWKDRHDWITIQTVSAITDPHTGDVTLTMTGTGTMDWNVDGVAGRYEANKVRLGRDIAPDRKPGDPDAPVLVAADYEVTHQTILLPDGGKGFTIDGEPVDEVDGAIHYQRTATLKNGRFEVIAMTRNGPAELSLSAAKDADTKTNAVFAKRLFVRAPAGVAAAGAATGVAIDVAAIGQLVDKGQTDAALARVNAMLAGAKTAALLAVRGMVLARMKRDTEADASLDEALALDPHDRLALLNKAARLRGLGRTDDALILLDRLVLVAPEAVESYLARAEVRAQAGQPDGALADYAIVLTKQPGNDAAWVGRVSALVRKGDREGALAEADAWAKARPLEATPQAKRGNMLALMNRGPEAKAALARSIAIEPTGDAYQTRLTYDLSGDAAAQRADLLALIKLEPTRLPPERAMRVVATDPSGRAAVLAAYDMAAKSAAPAEADNVAAARAAFEAEAGNPAPWLKRLDAEAAKAPASFEALNHACWYRATHKLQLDKALVDCDAALAVQRDAAILDSRGLVHLQRGEFAVAAADYDAALALQPKETSSLYGRGLTEARQGNAKASAADLAAARAIDARIDDKYRDYGLVP